MGLVGFGSEGKAKGIGRGTLATALGTFGRRGWHAGCGSPRGSSCLAYFLPVCALVQPISFLCPAHWLILAGNLLFRHRLRPFYFVISHPSHSRSPSGRPRVSSTTCVLVSSPTRGIVDFSNSVIVISVVAQKGGAGKTTLSVGLACAAAAAGLSAVVVDLDPQATAASWGDRREADAPAVLSVQPSRLARLLEAAVAQEVNLAVIDSAPRAEQSAIAAVKAANLGSVTAEC